MSFAVATAVRGLCGGVGRGAASAARAALAAATAKMVAPLAVATTAAVEAGAAAHMTTPPELAQILRRTPAGRKVKEAESKKMALVDGGPTRVAPREIPDSPTRYNVLKREYEKQLSAYRKLYKAEWGARKERERASVITSYVAARAGDAAKEEKRAKKKEMAAKVHAAYMKLVNEEAAFNRRHRIDVRVAYLERRGAARETWLNRLIADSATWIPEDKINEMITPALFAVKHPWYLEGWYAHRERKRLGDEQRESEGGLDAAAEEEEEEGGSDDPYDSDFELDPPPIDAFEKVKKHGMRGIQLIELSEQRPVAEIYADLVKWEREWSEKMGTRSRFDGGTDLTTAAATRPAVAFPPLHHDQDPFVVFMRARGVEVSPEDLKKLRDSKGDSKEDGPRE